MKWLPMTQHVSFSSFDMNLLGWILTFEFLTDLDILQVMVKMQKGVFHSNNIWYLKTLEAAFDSATIMERFDQAIEYGKALIPGYE